MSGTPYDQRERATDEYRKHHDTKTRRSGAGDRRDWQLEQLLDKGDISPEQSEAGWRWGQNYRICFGGGGRSCLDSSPRGTGWSPSEGREDASRDYHEALVAINGRKSSAGGILPSDVVTWLCVEDRPISGKSGIATTLGLLPGAAKVVIRDYLQVLSDHYASEDRRRGKRSTAETKEAALARFEPEVVPRRRPA